MTNGAIWGRLTAIVYRAGSSSLNCPTNYQLPFEFTKIAVVTSRCQAFTDRNDSFQRLRYLTIFI